VVALLLDFAIRHATKNAKSLDDVMRLVYWRYYKQAGRGFSDAEFQQACEEVAGISLSEVFEYVYTTKEPDYSKYLGYAGLKLESSSKGTDRGKKLTIRSIDSPDALQRSILSSWMAEK
jgi:predicted metalloprotease with PDZ domain